MQSNTTTTAGLTPMRRLVPRLCLTLLTPILLIMSVEGLLRLFHYGTPTAFFIKTGNDTYTSNDKFGWRFFPKAIARAPLPLSMQDPKPPGTFRIFVLGESAAMGDPEPAYGFSRILQVMLEEVFPTQRIEVINVSMSAINSHVVRLIARDCAKHQPDLFIIYMGNNEVVGPYGPGTAFQSGLTRLSFIRAAIWARSTRIGQFINEVVERLKPDTPRFWKSLEMFSTHRIRSDDPHMANVYANFTKNLTDILDGVADVHARTILCTVAVNLRDSPPFASMHPSTWTSDASNRWTTSYTRGLGFQNSGDASNALPAFQEALDIDPGYAQLQYQIAQTFHTLGRFDDARDCFARARDLDGLHFRTDSRLTSIVREIASTRPTNAVQLVDVERLFADPDHSPGGTPGSESFYEHVHFTYYGNYAIASALFSAITPLLGTTTSAVHPLSSDDCATQLALTPWDQYRIVQSMSDRMDAPPFTYQENHTNQMNGIRQMLASCKPGIMKSLNDDQAIYRAAIQRRPDDWQLRENFAKLEESRQDPTGAIEQWQRVTELQPSYPRGFEGLGLAYQAQGRQDQAIRHLQTALRLAPLDPFAYLNLGSGLLLAGRKDEGLQRYDQALALCPDNSGIHYTVGTSYLNLGDMDRAAAHFTKAIELDPNNAQAHNNLGIVLFKQGDRDGAQAHWRKALDIRPDFVDARHNLMGIHLTGGQNKK